MAVTKDKKVELPKEPSKLIRLALRDLRAVERARKTYRIEMGNWHWPRDGKCCVCLAGAVMAKSLACRPTNGLEPYDLPEKDALMALDSFRTGSVGDAFYRLGIPLPSELTGTFSIPHYDEDRVGFYRKLTRLANVLEALGH